MLIVKKSWEVVSKKTGKYITHYDEQPGENHPELLEVFFVLTIQVIESYFYLRTPAPL